MITKFFTLSLLAIFFKIWNSEAVNPQAGISETLNSIFKPPSKSIDIIPKADEELENLSEKTQRDLLGVTTCPSGCLQCSSTSYNGCDECKSWYFLLAGECLTVCPDGFSYTGAWTCEKGTSSPVFDISFDKIKGFLEINSDSGDCLVCGNDPYRFYPDYDSNDPFPTKDRGYYFDSSSSYMQMPPNSISKVGFRLNVDHTFSIWAYQISDADQSLFKKFDSQGNKIWGIRTVAGYIYYEWTHLKNGANDFSAYSYATGGVQVWNNYVFTFSKANGAFESKFYMNNAFVDTNSYDGDEKLIWDDEGPFYIGYSQDPNTGSGVGWTGFIAKISYYIDALSVTDISAFYGTCTNSCNSLCIPSGDCFSECDIYHYAETTGTCDGACGSSCTNPCVFSDRCTLCYSSSVTKCSGFGDGDKLDYSCYGNCETCGDSYYYTCLSCSTGFYLHHDTCITACPTSYHEATDGCTGSGGYVYDFILSEISGTITDTYGYFSLNSGSDSTKFYPNADSSDAIPAYQRGYYFNGESSYMALDNKIMFNYYQTHGFWLRNEGGTNTQSILSAVDDHSNSVLKIEITDTSLVLAIMINPDPKKDYVYILEPTMSFFDIPKHSWVYLTVLITFIRGTTYWKAYNFNDRTFIFNIYDGVMEPALPSYVTFGATRKNSAVSNYFKGFIYEMVYMSEAASSYKISQLFSTSCSGCTYCTASNLICLDKCGIHYYGYYGSCLPCMSTCKYGCISATTCNLCNDPGCYTCSVYETETCTQCYTDATVGTDLCGCNSGSANFDDVSGTCVECSSYCSKCNWPYMLECSSCPTGRYLTSEGICTPYCPYGCGDASRTSIIVDYVFTSISNSQTDSANQLIMYLGSKDDYYSTYDDNDPKILPYRGLYFTGSSYAQFPPTQYNDSQLYLGYSHSVDFWLFPLQYSGSIMSKFFGSSDLMYAEIVGGSDTLYKICYHLYSVDNSNSDNLCSSATITSSNSWGRLTWTFGFSSGVTTLSTYLDGTHQDTQTFTDNFIFDEDLYLNFVLGYSSSLSYYVGYIYSIKIYNYILGSISAGNSNCGCQWCTELGACLSTCAYNEAYNKESNSCESCPQDCKNGCKTSSACSICNNYLCSSCSNVEADGCRVCTTNAEGYITDDNNSDCRCYNGYYGNPSSLICESCFSKCTTCTGAYANACTACKDNWYLLPEGICVKTCPPGYSSDDNFICSVAISTFLIAFQFDALKNTQSDIGYKSLEIYCGNSDDFYPNYDSNDPWVLKDRGLYFSGNSYATYLKANNLYPFYFGIKHTFDIWAMPRYYEGDSMIYSKYSSDRDLITLQVSGTSSSYFLKICYNFISVVDGSTATLQCITSGKYDYSVWKRISWTIGYSSTDGSKISVYVDSTLLESATVPDTYFDENVDFTINLGSKSTASYFTGYIYSIYWYNYVITDFSQGDNTCGCMACDNQNNCLVTCTENEYYSEGSCVSCKSGCSGCINGDSCNMCDDQLCSTCSSLKAKSCTECTTNSEFDSSNICVCKDKYGKDIDACSPCDSSCETCSGISMYQCKSCASSSYLTSEGICSSICAFGCGDSTRNSLIVDFLFTAISNDQKDSINSIELFLGSSTDYYPNYDSEDPKILEYRGLYFSGSSNAKLHPNSYNSSQLYLGFSHSVDTWAFLSTDQTGQGCLITKSTSSLGPIMTLAFIYSNGSPLISICYVLQALDSSTTSNTCAFLPTTLGEWHRISLSLAFKDGESTLYIYLDGVASDPQVIAGFFYEDYNDGIFELGSYGSTNFIIGYIYSLKIYNYPKTDFSSSSSGCGCQACTDSDQCLSTCTVSESYNKDQRICESCLAGCQANGCVAADRCNICFDPICAACTTFEYGSCKRCRDHAAYDSDGICKCNSQFYWDKDAEACKACGTLCSSCSDKENCDKCLDDNTMSIDSENVGNCKCNGYAYYNGNECEACGDLCVSCDSTGCLKCADTTNMHTNSADSDHSCICNDGLYYDTTSAECKSCINQCKTCDSETSCTSCVDNADLNTGSCTCQTGYWASSDTWNCEACFKECEKCTGSSTNKCTSCLNSWLLLSEGFCAKDCPVNYEKSQTADSCTLVQSLLSITYKFNFLTNTQVDKDVGTFELYYGSSDDFYPNYDSNDPWVLQDRGLYFSGSSYATFLQNSGATPFVFGFYHTFDLWAMPRYYEGDGVIMAKYSSSRDLITLKVHGSSTDYYLEICYDFISISDGITSNFKCVQSGSYSFSEWKRISWSADMSSSYTSSLNLYVDSTLLNSALVPESFFDESVDFTTRLGSKSTNSYFTGYLYSFSYSSYVISSFDQGTNSCGCSICDNQNNCLGTCSESEYYSGTSCMSCKSDCSWCINGNSCNMCNDQLCSQCASLQANDCRECTNNAKFDDSDLCICNDGYTPNIDTCALCDSSCATCSGTNMYQCKSCYSAHYLTSEGICSGYCAFGCGDSTRNSLIVDFLFTKILNDQQESENLIEIYLGSSNDYYPDYDSSDPKILKYRGLYFSGSSSAKLPPNPYNSSQFYLGFSHAIDTWVYISPDQTNKGYAIAKWSSSSNIMGAGIDFQGSTPMIVVCYGLPSLDLSTSSNTCANFKTTTGEWHRYSWSLEFNDGESTIAIYVDGSFSAAQTANGYNYEGYTDAAFELGNFNSQDFFIGYIYSLKIYNYPRSDFSSSSSGCGCQACTDSDQCLSSCAVSESYNKDQNVCESCLSSCQNIGCVAADRCNVCFDPICNTCITFEKGSCTGCKVNADYDSNRMCKCNSEFYWDKSSETCKACGTLCSSCSDKENCDKCLDDNTMSIDPESLGNCKCNGYAYYNGNECEECGDLCVSCDSTGCLKCADTTNMHINSADSDHSCICNDGLYYDTTSTECKKCKSPCSLCKNENFCLSCIDSSMSLNDGICTCPSDQYFNDAESLCKSCINQCLACESETSCTSCVDHADLVDKSCNCQDGYTPYNNICSLCSSCLTCNGNEIYNCLSCATDQYLTAEGICSSYCAHGCSDTIRNSLIVNYIFSSISNAQHDLANSIEMVLGDSSSYYPNYDYYDPKILPYRGLYFDGSSYAQVSPASSQFYLGYSHTVDLWVYALSGITDTHAVLASLKSDSSTNELAAVQLSGSDTLFTSCYLLSDFTKSATSNLCLSSAVTENSWFRFTWTLKFSSGENTLVFYSNSEYKDQKTLLSYFYDESDNSGFFLGGYSSQYFFSGYIYSFTIYNYVLTTLEAGNNNCGCQACSDLNQCLSTCSSSEAYKLESNSCESCPNNCQNGCLTSSYCGICEDSLCSTCDDSWGSCSTCVSNADFNSNHVCECGSNYVISADLISCNPCNSMCAECSGREANKCKGCVGGSYMTTDGYCVFNCQLGYSSQDGTTCSAVNSDSLMVNFIFNQLSNTQLDTVSSLPIFFGTNSSFYPNYDENDPKVLKNRGLYFNGKSYGTLFNDGSSTAQVSFGHVHTFEIWLLVMASTEDMIVISKSSSDSALFLLKIQASSQTYSISLCYDFINLSDETIKNNECVSSQSSSYNKWTKISWILEKWNDNDFLLKLYLLSNLENSVVASSSYFNENSAAEVKIGSMRAASFFKGYIYSLRIHNYAIGHINGDSVGCGCSKCTEYGDCLADCLPSEYYSSNQCSSCLSSCTNGCVSGNTCNLCSDPICSKCTSLESGTCTTCKSDSTLDSNDKCVCDKYHYWSSTLESCETCSKFCGSCTSAELCQYCMDNDTMVLDNQNPGSCKCSDSAYSSPTGCFKCGTLCSSCSDQDNCNKCLDENTMSIDPENLGSCKCNGYAYYNGNECEECGDLCVSCDSTGCLKCADTTNMHTNSADSDHSCICNDGLYYDTTLTECRSCINQCKTCESETSCTSCVDNADFNTGSCICQDGYWASSDTWKCEACFKECEKCTGSSTNKCTGCLNSLLLLSEGFCVKNCPVNYEQSQNADTCTLLQSKLSVTYKFNFLTNTQVDKDVGTFELYYGSSDDFYPNYDSNDPWILQDRGLYFSGSSYATFLQNSGTAPFVFGFYHTFDLWAMPKYYEGDGVIMAKYSSSRDLITLKVHGSSTGYYLEICYDFISISDGTTSNVKCVQSGTYSFSEWKRISWSADMSSSYTSSLNLYIDSTLLSSASVPDSFFDESVDFTTRLGSKSTNSYFTGYLYSFAYHSYVISSFDQGSNTCGCSICDDQNNCLVTCSESEYYSESSCMPCKSGCSGCINGNSCNMCDDQLCSQCSSLQANDCTKCTINANFDKSNVCVCNEHSYGSSLTECPCAENYQYYNSNCVYCYRYIQSNEITASFTSTFIKIVLAFPVGLNTTGVTCSSLFPADVLEKFGTSYLCYFNTDATTFSVELGTNFALKNENISLNSGILKQNNKTECGYLPTSLNVQLSYTASFLYPSAKIDAPASVLYSCQNLTVSGHKSTGNKNQPLYYKWEISSSPYSSKLSKYNTDFQTQISQFTIPQSDLSNTTITITLTVRNYFSLTSTTSLTVDSMYSGIVVTFDKTVDYQLLAIDYTTYSIGVISSCEPLSEFSITWAIDSVSGNSSAIDFTYFWGNQTSSNFIIIPKRAFPPNVNITFKATVVETVNGMEGTGILSLVINPADPVVKVSRSSGNFGISENLAISANSSYDPNEYKTLSYEWSCVLASGADCSSFIKDRTAENLDVPQGLLSSGVEYSFTLNVYTSYGRRLKEDRGLSQTKAQSTSTIVISAVDYSTPTVNIIDTISGQQPTVVLPNQQLRLYADVSDPTKYSYEWTYDGEASISILSSLSTPYLIIAQDSMEPGRYYSFSLSINDGSHTSSYDCKFYTNSPPYGGSLTVSPSSGVESKTVFKMEALNWVDEESNTPITYSFGYINGDESVYMNSKNQTLTYYSMFPYIKTDLTTFVEVYDSLGSFTRKTMVVTISIDQNLDQSELYDDITSELNSAATNPQAFPGLISRLAMSTLNRESITNGEYSSPSSDQLKFLQSVLTSALEWTNTGINSMATMDSQSLTTYTNLLLTLTANPYLYSATAQSSVCSMLDFIVSKLDTSVPLSYSQSEDLFTVVDQSYRFNSSSLMNDTSSLDTAINTINNIQSVMADQMAVGESKSLSVGSIEVNVEVKAVSSLNGYNMKSTEGTSKVALPDNFAGEIASITSSTNVGLNLNILSPSNDHSSLSSSIVDFSVFDKDSKSSIHADLSHNISVQIPSYNIKYSNYTPQCVFLNTTSGNWSTKGCSASQLTTSYMACSCNHFTSFSIKNAAIGTLVNSNIGDTVNVSAFSDINATNAAGLYFCVGTLIAYGILAVYSIKKDRQDEREEDAKRMKKKGNPVKINKFSRDIHDKQEASRFEFVLGNSNRSEDNCDALENNEPSECLEDGSLSFDTPKEVFLYHLEEEPEYMKKICTSKETIASEKQWKQQFKEKHELLNIIFIKDLSKSRLSRATLFFLALIGQMFFTGLFYKGDSSDSTVTTYNSTNSSESSNSTTTSDDSDSSGSIQYKLNDAFISIYSVLIMLTIIIVLTTITNEKAPTDDMTEVVYRQTKKKNKIKRFIGNGVAWGIMLYFCWSIVLFSIQFDEQVSKTWVLNSAVSYALKIFVVSWVKGAITAYITLQIARLLQKIEKKKKENEEQESVEGEEQQLNDYKQQMYGEKKKKKGEENQVV